MSESHPSRRGAGPSDSDPIKVDVSEMPRVLQRITALSLRYPGRMAIAIGCSLGAAVASLTLPRLFGAAVDQAQVLLEGGAAVFAEPAGQAEDDAAAAAAETGDAEAPGTDGETA